MQSKNRFSEKKFIRSLRSYGYLVPLTEEQICETEKVLRGENIPDMPDSLKNPDLILKRGYIDAPITENKSTTSEVVQSMAAREGNKLTKQGLVNMKKDRTNAEAEVKNKQPKIKLDF